jgi:hypothetical protein
LTSPDDSGLDFSASFRTLPGISEPGIAKTASDALKCKVPPFVRWGTLRFDSQNADIDILRSVVSVSSYELHGYILAKSSSKTSVSPAFAWAMNCLTEQLQVSLKTIERHLKELADKVTRTGSKRNGRWSIANK